MRAPYPWERLWDAYTSGRRDDRLGRVEAFRLAWRWQVDSDVFAAGVLLGAAVVVCIFITPRITLGRART